MANLTREISFAIEGNGKFYGKLFFTGDTGGDGGKSGGGGGGGNGVTILVVVIRIGMCFLVYVVTVCWLVGCGDACGGRVRSGGSGGSGGDDG